MEDGDSMTEQFSNGEEWDEKGVACVGKSECISKDKCT